MRSGRLVEVGTEHGKGAIVTDRVGSCTHAPPHHSTLLPGTGSQQDLPSIHGLCFPQDWLLSCKHSLVFLRQRKSPLKPSSLSGCSFIFSFLFTVEVSERAVCSHHHSAQHLSGMSGCLPPPWEPCTGTSLPLSICPHPVLGTAGALEHPAGPVPSLPAGLPLPCTAIPLASLPRLVKLFILTFKTLG